LGVAGYQLFNDKPWLDATLVVSVKIGYRDRLNNEINRMV